MRVSRAFGCLLLVLAGCQDGPRSGGLQARLVPGSIEGAGSLEPIFDRDPTTHAALTAVTELRVRFPDGAEVQRVKAFGARHLSIQLPGNSLDLGDSAGWQAVDLPRAWRGFELSIILRPEAGDAALSELEFWGPVGEVGGEILSVAASAASTTKLSNIVVAPGQVSSATLTPRGQADGEACFLALFPHRLLARDVRRAWLVFEAGGLARAVSLERSLNGHPARAGFWLDGPANSNQLVDELNPAQLQGRAEVVRLCLPATATRTVELSAVRLVLATDDGLHWLDRDTSRLMETALDGNPLTGSAIRDTLTVGLDSKVSVDKLELLLDVPPSQAALAWDSEEPSKSGQPIAVKAGWLALGLPGVPASRARLTLTNGQTRPGLPSGTLSELRVAGSPAGKRIDGHQLILTYPLTTPAAGAEHAEHFGPRAFVAGWTQSSAGPARVELEGAPVSTLDGAFSSALDRPAGADEKTPWVAVLRATFPDGVVLEKRLLFDEDRSAELGNGAVGGSASDSRLFGEEHQTASGRIDPLTGGKVTLGERIGFEAPAGAVATPTVVSITRMIPEVVPKLDPGMVNVTAPGSGAYRFRPDGQQFLVPVLVTLPYDAQLLPDGMDALEVQTFFYDESAHRWEPLPRKELLRATQQVVSETTHFTFMINAVLVLPDHPGPASLNPTSLKDLKAASPAEGLDLIAAPEPGNFGSARTQLPIRIPRARGRHQPDLRLVYDSSAGNGWLGVGWNLSGSSITLDTRFGVPLYDGSERYLLDGEQLVPNGSSASCEDGSPGQAFLLRAERDFKRIARCDAVTGSHFEVTEKDGTLWVYGSSANSRLTSYHSPGQIAEWHLARVVDTNGNLSTYAYRLDQKRSQGDGSQGEDFSYLYLSRVSFTGTSPRRGSAALNGGSDGPYTVELRQEAQPGGPVSRTDLITSGRYGFKTLLRRRLGSIVVFFDGAIVREYQLSYGTGDFGKSLLTSIKLYGQGGLVGGQLFHQHTLDYTKGNFSRPFSSPGSEGSWWTLPAGDEDRLSATSESGIGVHLYGGMGFNGMKEGGSGGLRTGFNTRFQNTIASFLDLNGDSIPDRVRVPRINGTRSVLLGNVASRSFSKEAPPGDPHQGEVSFPASLPGLGAENGTNINLAAQGQFMVFSASFGGSFSFTNATSYLLDADGDGLVDFIGPGEVLFNQPRGTSPCPSTGSFCFSQEKTIQLGVMVDAGAMASNEETLLDAGARIRAAMTPSDGVIEWIAPFPGVVAVSGNLAWSSYHDGGTATRDGVRLRAYDSAGPDGGQFFDGKLAFADNGTLPLLASNLQVTAGSRLYFRLSTGPDFPVETTEDGGARSLEEVSFAPTIKYQCSSNVPCLPDGGSYWDPTGVPLNSFNPRDDLRMAGRPFGLVQGGAGGLLRLTWKIDKPAMSDDLRFCVLRFLPQVDVNERTCESAKTIGNLSADQVELSASTVAPGFTHTVDVVVNQGEQLIFRMETDLPADMSALHATITGEMKQVCPGDGGCYVPTEQAEKDRLAFVAEPYVAAHENHAGVPVVPLVMPFSGTLVVTSSVGPVASSAPVFVSIRGVNRQILKHKTGSAGSASVPVEKGEQLFFETHSEAVAQPALWTPLVFLHPTGPDGGMGPGVRLFPQPVFTWDQTAPYPRRDALVTPFGGGFHGWYFGSWSGGEDEPFDMPLIRNETAEQPAPPPKDTSPKAQLKDQRERMRKPETFEAKRLRVLGMMVAHPAGTAFGRSTQVLPGLKPLVPAFTITDGTAWYAADGTWNASKKGGYFATPQGSTSVEAVLDLGETTRSSLGVNVTAGVGLADLNLSVSTGASFQQLDVLDFNGDRIVDVVGRGSVRITDRHTMGQRGPPISLGAGSALRSSQDLGISFGMGISAAVDALTSAANIRSARGMFPSLGGGLAVTLSASDGELMDLNGDGLPDRVLRVGNDLSVQLNLGDRFGEPDLLPIGTWTAAAGSSQLVTGEVQGKLDKPDPEDKEATDAAATTNGVVGMLSNEEQLRRSLSATLSLNLGFTLNESYGVTANLDTSLSGTEVAMIDVTGDGLPDYVRRDPDGHGLLVKVNYGYGFGRQQRLPLPDWVAGTEPSFALGEFGGLFPYKGSVQKLLGVDANADGLLEASGSHTRLPSVGFVVTYSAGPLVPIIGNPWLYISGGVNVELERVSGFEMGFVDIDGDGFADHVLKTDKAENGDPSRVFVRHNNLGGGNLLEVVHRPLGGTVTVHYKREGNTVAMPESRWVVDSSVVDDGVGRSYRTEWTFTGGQYDRSEREFLGFGQVTQRNPDGSSLTRTFDTSGYASRGLLVREEVRDDGGRLFSATLNDYGTTFVGGKQAACLDSVPFFLGDGWCESVFRQLLKTEQRHYEGLTTDVDRPRKTGRQRFTYDGFGNVENFVDEGDTADSTDDVVATLTYETASALGLYFVGHPTNITVTSGTGAVLRERSSTYDRLGNLSQLRSALSAGRVAVTDLTWEHGNLRTLTLPPNAKGDRYQLTYGYDLATKTWPETVSDSFGYESTARYDLKFGEVVSTTDLNGQVTTRSLDGFGRVTSVTGPNEQGTAGRPTIEVSYQLGKPAMAYTRNLLPNGSGQTSTLDVAVLVDGLGRERQTKTTAEIERRGVGMSVSGAVEYDAMGRVIKQGQPRFSPSVDGVLVAEVMLNPTLFHYDVLGRTTRTEEPNGSVTQVAYGFGQPGGNGVEQLKVESTDAHRNQRAVYRDLQGRVVAVEERIDGLTPTTRYEYNPLGELTGVTDAEKNVTRMTYDLLGRRLSLDNPDTGLTSYSFDEAGNLTKKVTPNLRAESKAVSYEYEFNRLRKVDHPFSADVTYSYGPRGAPHHAAGRVTLVEDEVGREAREYGRLGELTKQTRTIRPLKPGEGPAVYALGYEWDSFGRLLKLHYPDGEQLSYGYDRGGLLKTATGYRPWSQQTEPYLVEAKYDEFGQRTLVTLGNGVTTRYRYEDTTRRLATLQTKLGGVGGTTIQALSYGYDRVGNIQSLTNALPAQVPNHFGGKSGYVFGYDALYRLTSASGEASPRPGVFDRFTAGYTYSKIHNLERSTLSREVASQVGVEKTLGEQRDESYLYAGAGAGPHQATRIGSLQLAYDRNGNTVDECEGALPCIPGQSQHFGWNEENWLTEANKAGKVVRFLYDAAGQRVAKLSAGGPTVTVGQWWAVKGTSHASKHVFAGSGRIATKVLPPALGNRLTPGAPAQGSGWPNTSGCVPSRTQPGKCATAGGGVLEESVPNAVVKPATYYYHPDHLGSTQWMTDDSGKVHERIEYFPYGEVWREASARTGASRLKQALLYTGKQLDEETGLTYFGARYYDSRKARWLSADPALGAYVEQGNSGSGPLRAHLFAPANLSLFSYANHTPVLLKDPNGEVVPLLVMAAILIVGSQVANENDTYKFIAVVPGGAGILAADKNIQGAKHLGGALGALSGGDMQAASTESEKALESFVGALGDAAGGKIAEAPAKAAGPAAKGGGDAKTLYRAVGADELADLQATGRYRVPAGGTEGKYFFDAPEQTSNFARMMGDQPYTPTSVKLSPAELSRGQAIKPAGEGPAYFFNTADVPAGPVTIHNRSVLP